MDKLSQCTLTINHFPTEIISTIFCFVLPPHNLDLPFRLDHNSEEQRSVSLQHQRYLHTIQLVCQLWRTISLSTPQLWTDVFWDGIGQYGDGSDTVTSFKKCMLLSKGIDIDVTVILSDAWRGGDMGEGGSDDRGPHAPTYLAKQRHAILILATEVLRNCGRVRCLSLHNPVPAIWPMEANWIRLTRLELTLRGVYDHKRPLFLDYSLLKLRELSLTVQPRHVAWAKDILGRVDPNQLRELTVASNLSTLHPFIRRLYRLEQLFLRRCSGRMGEEPFVTPNITVLSKTTDFFYSILPVIKNNVTTLEIDVSDFSNQDLLINLPQFPALRRLIVHIPNHVHLLQQALSAFLNTSPNIHRLEIHYSSEDPPLTGLCESIVSVIFEHYTKTTRPLPGTYETVSGLSFEDQIDMPSTELQGEASDRDALPRNCDRTCLEILYLRLFIPRTAKALKLLRDLCALLPSVKLKMYAAWQDNASFALIAEDNQELASAFEEFAIEFQGRLRLLPSMAKSLWV